MITVHYLNESRAHRTVWLLEELSLPYEIVRYERDRNRQAPKALRDIHPLGKSPVITDGGRTLAESGAIAEYIIDAYGGGRLMPPRGTPAYLDYNYWMHYSEGSAMPLLFIKYVFQLMPARAPFLVRPIIAATSRRIQKQLTDPQMKNHAEFWEATLTKTPWFAGEDFTAADIQMAYPVILGMKRFGYAPAKFPGIADWTKRVRARPAYSKALDAVGESET